MLKNLPSEELKRMTYQEQVKLFELAKDRSIELLDILNLNGYTIDDLVYQNSETREWRGGPPRELNDFGRPPNSIPIVSFFTGCGGMDLGFEAAGFNHVAAFEFDERFCKTLRRNRPQWNVVGPPTSSGDISDVEGTIATLKTIIQDPFDGVFIGGPPCQPFSVAASQRFTKQGSNYKRIGFEHDINGCLLLDYVEIIERFKPMCFVIENVPGLRDLDGGMQLRSTIARLEQCGYEIEDPIVINAAHFGVPQFRERLFVVGTRNGRQFRFPQGSGKLIGCGSVLLRGMGYALNSETRAHKLNSVIRYCRLEYGQRDYLGRVDRLDPCIPSKTVIAGGSRGGGRSHLHPEVPRTLTVRECARLQTFPDDYVFVGPTARQFTQVGNAVPPLLAAQLAFSMAESVFGVCSDTPTTNPKMSVSAVSAYHQRSLV